MSLLAQAESTGDLILKNESGVMTIKSPLRAEITDLSSLFNTMITIALPLAMLIFFCVTIYAGFILLTSEGSADKIKQAQGIFKSSIIGLILLLVAFLIVRIVATIFGFGGGILPQL